MPTFTLQQAFDLAVQHHQAGRLAEAEPLYRQVLAVAPTHAETLHLLGVIALQVGRNDVAVELIRQAIALLPTVLDFHSNLGLALANRGDLDEAIAAFHRALELQPDSATVHNNLGNALKDQGRFDEAIAAYRHALRLQPGEVEARNNLGVALAQRGHFDEAMAAYRQALQLKPDYAEAYNNLGNALKDQGRLDEAIGTYRQALALKPKYATAHVNLGNALQEKGQLDEAIEAYLRAIQLKPDHAEAHGNLGNVFKEQTRFEEAMECYRRATALRPESAVLHSNLVYTLLFHPSYDAALVREEHRRWHRQFAEPLRKFQRPHDNDRDPERRLRVGYVSPDFSEHVVGRNMLPLFANHDRVRFEIFCYAQVARPDAVTARIRAGADHWRSTVGIGDEPLAAQIREDRIDILVDLTLHMARNRLLVFARKPAPVQVTFGGYPGSTGQDAIDCRFSDPFLDPAGMDESIYSERTVRLPHSFWCYDPLEGRDLPVHDLPAQTNGHVTFGCLNNFCKVNDPVLRLWCKVLHAVPSSRLLLLAPEGSARQRTLDLLGREGITSGRIEFVPQQPRRGYLELYHRIDLGLDTLPYNGHTTSLDSFWMGVPVVTLAGQTIVGRAGLSQLMNLGLPELIAQSPDEYVKIAAELARDLPRLRELRSTLRGRMEASPLMDAARFARDIEAAYRQMWRTWCARQSAPRS